MDKREDDSLDGNVVMNVEIIPDYSFNEMRIFDYLIIPNFLMETDGIHKQYY